MARARPAVLAAALLAGGVAGAIAPPRSLHAVEGKVDVEAVGRALAGFAKRKSLGSKDPEEIRRRLAPLDEAGLVAVLAAIRAIPEKDRGAAAPAVERLVADALAVARWSPAVLLVPDAARRLESSDPAVRSALLADATRLEDPEPGTRLALRAMESASPALRLRAVDALADLASWSGDPARLLPALRRALDDPSVAVRDLALERLADLADPAAVEWSLAHLYDAEREEAEVRETREVRAPGERAFLLLARASGRHTGVEPAEARALPQAERDAITADFGAWWAQAGNGALRDGGDGPFDPVPRVTTLVVPKDRTDDVRVRWWSDRDRAAFEATYEQVEVAATSRLDWSVSYRVVVMAAGARQGTWDLIVRRVRCGARQRIARRGFGLVETSVQNLLDGRLRFYVRAYESR